MDELSELVAYEQIRRMKFRYMRAIDTHDLEIMRDVFCEDCRSWFGNGTYSNEGKANVLGFFERLLVPGFISSHIAVHSEIDLHSEDAASAIWRVEDTCHFIEPYPTGLAFPVEEFRLLQGAGHYYDEYVRIEGAWKIKSSGYVRIYEHMEYRDGRESKLIVDPNLGIRR